MTHKQDISSFFSALPYWLSLTLIPLLWIAAIYGGWTIFFVLIASWNVFILLDVVGGVDPSNKDPQTQENQLFWYRLVTLIWVPIQFLSLFGVLYIVGNNDHSFIEKVGIFIVMGFVTGTVGINYSHELMHQKNKLEQGLADLLLAMVLYSHFRSEHLLVHHRYVGTPRDPVTARYGESFYAFFPRVLIGCLRSAFTAEKEKLARRDLPWHDRSNPFFRYWALQAMMLALAFILGGALGVGLFILQAFVAIFHLEVVNYVEHYGLTRKHLGEGKYEHVMPRHSWNTSQRISNWLLINLQRHSDHHYKPNRRFPLLQTYDEQDAPQLPYGYPVMVVAALMPRFWKSRMNPRVRKWRAMYYPEITDWTPYTKGQTPMPR